MADGVAPSWEAFVAEVARLTDATPSQLLPDTRIFRDLDLDSLAVSELGAYLAIEFEDELLLDSKSDDWAELTLAELFARCTTGRTTGSANGESLSTF